MSKIVFKGRPEQGETTITLNGETYQMKFASNTIRILCEENNIVFSELSAFFQKNPVRAMGALVRAAITDSVLRYNSAQEVPSIEEVCCYMDEIDQKDRDNLNLAWSNAQFMGNALKPKETKAQEPAS